MEQNELPIVVFDSGVGGISVLRELVRQMPAEQFLYFGDSANAPYGTKSTEEIRRLTLDNMALLEPEGFKAIVIACNTATSAAIVQLRARYSSLPVIGIEPALKLAVSRHPGGKILVMATNTTLREEKFARLTAQCRQSCQICSLPCPGLMEFVEQGILDSPELEAFLRAALLPYLDGSVDAVVLGCTHYPFLRPLLQRIIGPDTELLDGSEGTARETRRRLEDTGLLRTQGSGGIEFRSSLPSETWLSLCRQLLAWSPENDKNKK